MIALLNIVLAAAPAPATGQHQSLPGPGAAEAVQIVNGELESEFPAAVSLGVGPIHVCSGSLITPRIVLSAAHCSGDIPLEAVVQFGSANFGDELANPEHTLTLESAVLHPDYVPLGPLSPTGEFDLAVTVLTEDAPVEPVFFRTEPMSEDDIGKVVRSVGFGIDETGQGSGVKRSADLLVSDFDTFFLISDSDDNEGANICSGDSGGPQYAQEDDGRWVQWAVHSWGDQDCLVTSGSTRTDIGTDWILDQVEAVHGTRDLCATNGLYDDGTCDRHCPVIDPDCVSVVVLGDGEYERPRGCSIQMNKFCSPVVLMILLGLSRRRFV